MLKINMIFACSLNGVIGNKGAIPWNIPEDMKRFKELTMGHPVIMGRKTWDSLPEKFRPLPGRKNYVLTKQTDWKAEGAYTINNVTEVLLAAGNVERGVNVVLWVIGGSEVYNLFQPIATSLYVTEVHSTADGDAFAPHIDLNYWRLAGEEKHTSVSGLDFVFKEFKRDFQQH